jgi:phospholipase/carboxylesterase
MKRFIVTFFCIFSLTANAADDAYVTYEAADVLDALLDLENRDGVEPKTPDGIPHQQHNQNAPVSMQEHLKNRMAKLSGMTFEATPFSLSGSIGWRLEEPFAKGSRSAFIQNTFEFAHQHVPADGSLHMLLPNNAAQMVIEKGWGILHPITDSVSGADTEYLMVFGPRNEADLKAVWVISLVSYYQARGHRN